MGSGLTILSRASAHKRSQLKRQKLGVGGYTEKVRKWFNYHRASGQVPTPDAKLAARGY